MLRSTLRKQTPSRTRNYQLFVRGIDSKGNPGVWSDPHLFQILGSILPGRPEFTGPIGSTPDRSPTFTWNAFANASYSEIRISNVAQGLEVIHQSGIFGTSYTPEVEFVPGKYQAFIRGWNDLSEYGSFSNPLVFEVTGPSIPNIPTLTGPLGSINDTSATITWNASDGTENYHMLVYNFERGEEIANVFGINSTEYTIEMLSASETYQVFVQAELADGGTSAYSEP